MSQPIGELIETKPSKLFNLVYFLFGYILASAFVPSVGFDAQGLLVIGIVAGAIGTFLFYARPIERVLLLALLLWNKGDRFSWPQGGLSGTFGSVLLQNAKEKILGGGYFFLSLQLLVFSGRLSTHAPKWLEAILLAFSAVPLIVAYYEASGFPLKLHILATYYRSLGGNEDAELATSLSDALRRRDWLAARNIVVQSSFLASTGPHGGLCPFCETLTPNAHYCPNCNFALIRLCGRCGFMFSKQTEFVMFCPMCGESIEAALSPDAYREERRKASIKTRASGIT